MKTFSLTFFLFILLMTGYPQISIDQADMPQPGDTIRVSIATSIPVDYTKTAMDTTWDFSALFPVNQRLDSFLTRQSTPLLYQMLFSNANLASPGGGATFPGMPVTDPFTFYESSPNSFKDLGFAFTISGLPAALKYLTPDIYYPFPIPFSGWSSNSAASIGFPGLFTYYSGRNRTSFVDGWGSLTTPYGTFSTIRVKSHLIQYDSLYIDTLGAGVPLERDIIQYKWLAKGMGIPVLQISEEGPVATAVYRDFYRSSFLPLTVNLGSDTSVYYGSSITITAQVTGGTPPYTYIWSTFETTPSITVTADSSERFSVFVIDADNTFGYGSKMVTIKYPGIRETTPRHITVYPNPAGKNCSLKGMNLKKGAELRIINALGIHVKTIMIQPTNETSACITLPDLVPGLYFISVDTESELFLGKVLVKIE